MNLEWLFVIFGVLWLAALVFWIWALVDCLQVPDDSMYQSGTKLVWVLVIVFLNWIGAVIYLAVGRPKHPPEAGSGPGSGAGTGTGRPATAWGEGQPRIPPPPGDPNAG